MTKRSTGRQESALVLWRSLCVCVCFCCFFGGRGGVVTDGVGTVPACCRVALRGRVAYVTPRHRGRGRSARCPCLRRPTDHRQRQHLNGPQKHSPRGPRRSASCLARRSAHGGPGWHRCSATSASTPPHHRHPSWQKGAKGRHRGRLETLDIGLCGGRGDKTFLLASTSSARSVLSRFRGGCSPRGGAAGKGGQDDCG